MIDGVRYIAHLNPNWSNIPKICKSLANMASKVALIAIHLTLFTWRPGWVVITFTVGFVLPDQIQEISRKVDIVFLSCVTRMEKIAMAVTMGLFAIYSQPISIIVITSYLGATWGAYLQTFTEDRYHQHQAHHA